MSAAIGDDCETNRDVGTVAAQTTDLVGHPLVALALTALGSDSSTQAAKREAKFDKKVQELVDASTGEEARVRVIVTVKAGARRGLLRGCRPTAAPSGLVRSSPSSRGSRPTCPKRLVRMLANDKDVLSVSFDAPVQSDGVATAVTGTPDLDGYSLRATLGLEAAGNTPGDADAPAGRERLHQRG